MGFVCLANRIHKDFFSRDKTRYAVAAGWIKSDFSVDMEIDFCRGFVHRSHKVLPIDRNNE